MSHRGIAICLAGRHLDKHAAGRFAVLDLRIAVAGDLVVAALAQERIESDKAGRIVAVGKIAANRAVNSGEGVGANRGIARRCATTAGTDRDRHSRRGIAILNLRAAVTGDGVVAAIALE